jgi:hypothetical protein
MTRLKMIESQPRPRLPEPTAQQIPPQETSTQQQHPSFFLSSHKQQLKKSYLISNFRYVNKPAKFTLL